MLPFLLWTSNQELVLTSSCGWLDYKFDKIAAKTSDRSRYMSKFVWFKLNVLNLSPDLMMIAKLAMIKLWQNEPQMKFAGTLAELRRGLIRIAPRSRLSSCSTRFCCSSTPGFLPSDSLCNWYSAKLMFLRRGNGVIAWLGSGVFKTETRNKGLTSMAYCWSRKSCWKSSSKPSCDGLFDCGSPSCC